MNGFSFASGWHLRRLAIAFGVAIAGVAWVVASAAPVWAGDSWPQFRGPNGDGKTDAVGLPIEFNDDKNVVWKTPVTGKAWSSPVVWGKQVWVTNATEDGKQLSAVCLDLDSGKIVHDVRVFEVEKPQYCHPMNSYGTSTPVIEPGRVYVHFGAHGTACLDTSNGKILWTRNDLKCDHFRGPASSPIVYKNLLIVHYDGFDLQYVVAFNKESGETVWKKDRSHKFKATNGDNKKAYGTPHIITVEGKDQLVSPFAEATIAYNPADGSEIWNVVHGGMNVATRPLYEHGLIILTTGAGGDKMLAVRPTGTGDITKTHVAWRYTQAVPTRPSQIIVGDLMYMVSDDGVASCVEVKEGKQVWQKRLAGGGKFSASPILAENRLYFFGEDGQAPVLAVGREYKELAVNNFGPGFMASPAVVGKALILRSRTHVYRFEQK